MGADDKCWLKPEQVEAMAAAAREGRHSLRDDALITLLYDTGLRRAELSQVDRAMVDLEDGDLRIPISIQKDYPNDQSPSPATFELDPAGTLGTLAKCEEYFSERDDDSPALFPSQKGERMTPKGINDVVQRAARRAEIRPYSYEGRRRPTLSRRTHSGTASLGGCSVLRRATSCTTFETGSATRRS